MGLRYPSATKTSFYIPENKEEWKDLKSILIDRYDFEDSPETWTFILSHLQGIKMPILGAKFVEVVAYYKRWKIAKVLQDEKQVYIRALEDKLREKMEALAKEQGNEGPPPHADSSDLPVGASHPEGELQELPATKETVVRSTSW